MSENNEKVSFKGDELAAKCQPAKILGAVEEFQVGSSEPASTAVLC